MGVGFWAFIANIYLTLRQGAVPAAPADRWLARFVGVSVTALLLGTIQGVIQTITPIHDWLDGAQGTGWMVTPFAHALFGAAHVNDGGITDTSFATAIGGGIDYRLIHGIAWRVQGDEVHTRFFGGGQDHFRFSTGIDFRF